MKPAEPFAGVHKAGRRHLRFLGEENAACLVQEIRFYVSAWMEGRVVLNIWKLTVCSWHSRMSSASAHKPLYCGRAKYETIPRRLHGICPRKAGTGHREDDGPAL